MFKKKKTGLGSTDQKIALDKNKEKLQYRNNYVWNGGIVDEVLQKGAKRQQKMR